MFEELKKQIRDKEVDLSFDLDPSECEILGVFGSYLYIKRIATIFSEKDTEQNNICMEKAANGGISMSEFADGKEQVIVIKIAQTQFIKLFKLWIAGKRSKCESYNEFCGVMGYFIPEEFDIVGEMDLYEEVKDETKEFGYRMEKVFVPLVSIREWDEHPDFEHG